MTWNEDRERLIAAAELGDATPRIAADLLVASRKRAFEAEHKAQQLQTDFNALKAAHAWIKTSERIPEDNARFLAVVADNKGTEQVEIVDFLSRGPEFLFADGNETKIVTHWQPLPEPPK